MKHMRTSRKSSIKQRSFENHSESNHTASYRTKPFLKKVLTPFSPTNYAQQDDPNNRSITRSSAATPMMRTNQPGRPLLVQNTYSRIRRQGSDFRQSREWPEDVTSPMVGAQTMKPQTSQMIIQSRESAQAMALGGTNPVSPSVAMPQEATTAPQRSVAIPREQIAAQNMNISATKVQLKYQTQDEVSANGTATQLVSSINILKRKTSVGDDARSAEKQKPP